jgi:valyl-tRNA synthetase
MGIESLPKTFDFQSIERRLYRWWEVNGYFRPTNDPARPGFDPSRKPFVISIPPPNVTGELHLGHAMFVSIEDLLIRYQRMRGVPTLWVPGSDHAGIATQLQVERLLEREGTRREAVGREKFVERVWEWKRKYGGIIFDQLRRLGASCDWDRERFTLDEGLSRAVREAFVHLYDKGLIYRGPRLVNWSPGLRTAVSDLEVEYSEEPGTLYYFKYRLKGSSDFIPVATTRPESILGDTAVAVHPQDERYARFVGATVLVPILEREIPVIADEKVEREFATGAVKVTPGHDATDYEIGQRHGLPVLSILDEAARINAVGGPYQGLDRFEARKRLWEDMRHAGLVIKEEPHTLSVPRSQRGGEIIEPMISTQWFVRIKPLADAALAAVRDGRVRIIPERFEKVYANWMENIQDWCISRQLWWGHRIPVWYCPQGHQTVTREDPVRCTTCGAEALIQDPDVLDTWFSSGLWPYSTLGWPDQTPDLAYFYPTSVLETGYDILFFWVARMIMMGLEFTGQPPFHTVYLHGIIRDSRGRKMSKSLGNVVDPRWVMDGATLEQIREAGTSREVEETYPRGLPAMGTDALRFTLLTSGSPGNDLNLSLDRVEANRNFANKLWNAGRFVIGNLGNLAPSASSSGLTPTLADRWIASRLAQTVAEATRLMENYQFGEAGRQVYDFFWGEFADWYVEISKLQLAESPARARSTARILVSTLDSCLRLLHPFTPFVTEELWGSLRRAALATGDDLAPAGGWSEALIIAPWPTPLATLDEPAVADFTQFMDIVRVIRNLRTERKVPAGARLAAKITAGRAQPTLEAMRSALVSLAHLDESRLEFAAPGGPREGVALTVGPVELHVMLETSLDAGLERARLEREVAAVQSQIDRLEKLLAGDFAVRAPVNVVEKEREKLAEHREVLAKLKRQSRE